MPRNQGGAGVRPGRWRQGKGGAEVSVVNQRNGMCVCVCVWWESLSWDPAAASGESAISHDQRCDGRPVRLECAGSNVFLLVEMTTFMITPLKKESASVFGVISTDGQLVYKYHSLNEAEWKWAYFDWSLHLHSHLEISDSGLHCCCCSLQIHFAQTVRTWQASSDFSCHWDRSTETKKTMKNNLVSLHFSAYCKWKITIRTFFYYGLLFKSVFFFSEKSVAVIFSKNTSHLRSRRKLIIRNSLFFDVIFFSPPKFVKIFDFFSPHIFNVCCLQSGSFHGQGNVVHLWEDWILLGK